MPLHVVSERGVNSPAMADSGDLLADLDAFLREHRRCDDLEAAVDDAVAWMQRSCRAGMARPAHPADRAP